MVRKIKHFIRYVLREAYRAIRKGYAMYYILGILVLCLLANIAMACFRSIYGMNDGSFSYNLIIFAEGAFVIPYYSCIILADIIFGREYPDPHIKDGVTGSMKRWELYIGKYAATLVLGGIMFAAAFILLVSTTLLFGIGDVGIGWDTISDFLQKALVALPLWMAGIAIGQCFLFAASRRRNAFIGYYILVLLIPRLIILLASEKIHLFPFTKLVNILITPQFQALQFYFTMDIKKCIILGAVYSIIASTIGIISFYKRK